MKVKFVFLLIAIALCHSLLAQAVNQKNAKGEKHGPWRELYPNSKIPRYEGQYHNGQPRGTFKYYYDDKVLKAEMVFDATNSKISRVTMYDVDGKLSAYGKYVNKEKDSVWTYYSPPGFMSYTETFKVGVLHGKKTIYYPSVKYDAKQKKWSAQQVTQEYNYVNGILNGDVREYYDNGTLKTEGTYINSNYHGEVKKYHPNGKISFLERYKHGQKHGWWFGYDMNGKEIGKRFFQDGAEFIGEGLKKKLEDLKARGVNPNDCGK